MFYLFSKYIFLILAVIVWVKVGCALGLDDWVVVLGGGVFGTFAFNSW